MADIARAKEINIAVRAHSGEHRAFKKWGPTIDYLNQQIPAYRFIMIPYVSLMHQLTDARHKRFEFLLTNPSTYVELEASHGAKALLTLVNNRRGTAQTRFGSVIFTHIDNSDIINLTDLKGKDFIAVNRLGFGGWRVGLKVMLEHGVDPEADFNSLNFADKQPAVVEAVLDKKVHAGMVRTDMLERLADKGRVNLRNIRVLNQQHTKDFPFFHSSPLYPEWPFAVMPHTSQELAGQVKQALLQLDKNHPAAKAGKYMAWSEPLDYTSVRKLLADLGVAPFTNNNIVLYLIILLVIISSLFLIYYFRMNHSSITDRNHRS